MEKKRIMVVEDEGITAMMIKSSLEEMGYVVTSTEFSGEEAVKKASKDKPDLALMDIVLNGKMDGIEAAGQIHARFKIPIVYLTAHSDDGMLKRIKRTEPFGYILKPFNERELRTAIELAFYKNEVEKRLRATDVKLRKHREQLTGLVEERTAELRSASELLLQEINDRRQAEAEAVRASHLAALGELAAGVAHEINNPVNGIINYAQILINQSNAGTQEYDILRRIIKEGDRISEIIRSLLCFARDSKEAKHPVHIHEIMNESLSLSEIQLKKEGIDLRVNVPSHLPRITAHPQQIEQVFLNIISNARYALTLKYPGAHEKKVLDITAGETTVKDLPHLQIIFHDRGIGIPAMILDKILNPFFSTKPAHTGTGLGLSISHGIITDHGGELIIESLEGEYTRVIINLPLPQ